MLGVTVLFGLWFVFMANVVVNVEDRNWWIWKVAVLTCAFLTR